MTINLGGCIGFAAGLGMAFGHWLGRRARRETILTYADVDIRPKLAQLGRAFRGRKLSGTMFDVGNDSEAVGGAHEATSSLIWIAMEADRASVR
jgi:hypothetical protein